MTPPVLAQDAMSSLDSLQDEVDKYLDKVKHDEPPQFICDLNNRANVDLIVQMFEGALPRVAQLAKCVQTEPLLLPVPAPVTPPKPAGTFAIRLPLISEVWNGADPANYHAQIHVGISNTPFYVTIDTGSSLLWLQSAVDGSQPVADQSTYVPPKSGTAHIADADNEVISYGDGRIVKMRLYNDLVNIAGVIANDQAVGAVATKDMGSSLRQNRANGLLGLGTTLTGSMEAKYRNLAQTLFSEGKIKFPSFSFVGPRNDPAAARRAIDQKTWQQPRGELVVGALPADVQDEKGIVWCPLSGDPPQRWLVKLNSVIINGDEDNPICEDQFALVDSGTSYIITHPDRFAEVQKRLGGKVMTLGDKYEDRFIAFPEQNLKSIQFNFGRQDEDDPGKNLARSFPLGNDDLNLGRDQDNLCISSITTFAGFPFPDNYWILGGIFIDNLVVVFDFTDNDRKIGFASLGPSVDLDTSVSKMENGSNGTT